MFNDYNDPIISQWHMQNGQKYSKIISNEPHIVVGGMFALMGLPDISDRVRIDGYIEININSEIKLQNEFKVDYTNGYVFMHSNKEGLSVNVTRYASRGVNYYPASRIWTKKDNFGNVSETASEMFDKIDYINDVTNNLEDRIADGKSTDKTLKTTILTAEDRKVKLDTSINNANSINNTLSHTTTGTIRKATDTNGALNRTIGTANISKSNLDGAIDESATSKTNLDKSISSANNINDTLGNDTNGTIKRATDRNTELNNTINKANNSKSNLDASILSSSKSKSDLDSSVVVANTSKMNLDNSITVANNKNEILKGNIEVSDVNISQVVDIMQNSTLIYQPAVNTYSNLATTYPNAQRGYFVNVLDTQKWYRYDGTKWIHISTFDGTDFDAIFNYAKYIWIEEVTVNKNALSFTLPSNVGALDKLIIKDTKYQTEWLEGIHWNRTAQTISFTESGGLPEKLTFIIKNIGKDLKLEVDDSKVNLDDHASTKKTELNSHTVAKKNELNSYRTEKELQLDSYTITKEEQLNSHNVAKKSELDSHTNAKKGEINNLTSDKKVDITSHADGEKVGLDNSIATASQSKIDLDSSTVNANEIYNTLSNEVNGTIKKATDKDVLLKETIASAISTNATLGDTYVIADATNDSLNVGIDKAELLKSGLDTSVVDGTALKGELDQIIDGTDYQSVIQDVNDLKLSKADKVAKEVKSVVGGGNSLTVTNVIKADNEVQIVDTKYGVKWIEGVHWNRVAQVVTFTSPMPENLTFEIINMG